MTDDLDRAAAKIVRAELKQFADEFVSGVLATVAGAKPPHAGGEQTPWTNAIAKVLEKMARRKNCDCYPWLLDYVWWSQKDGEEATGNFSCLASTLTKRKRGPSFTYRGLRSMSPTTNTY